MDKILGVSTTMQAQYVSIRWLTTFYAINDFLSKFDGIFHLFISAGDRKLYANDCFQIYHNLYLSIRC